MWNIIFLLIWDVCVLFIAYQWICGYNLVLWQSKIASVFTFITFSTNIKAVRGKNAFWSRTCGGLKSGIIGLSWSNAWESVYISWEYDCYLDVQVRQYHQFCFIYPLPKMIKSPFSSHLWSLVNWSWMNVRGTSQFYTESAADVMWSHSLFNFSRLSKKTILCDLAPKHCKCLSFHKKLCTTD